MKIRTGFVSNSSSQSFVIIGYPLTAMQYSRYKKDSNGLCGKPIVETRYEIYLGVIVSYQNDQSGEDLNPLMEVDWKLIQDVETEGARLGLGKPRIVKVDEDI